jgi:endonuclease/exonuclease/phosphatase family metal-dependent hydrolase
MSLLLAAFLTLASHAAAQSTDTFTVAAYNIENWVLMERDGKPDQPKPQAEKEAVFKVLAQVRPDVLGIEEMGTTNELSELAGGLRERGLDYAYREWIQGGDPMRHVALLSRFPIAARFSNTQYTYLLNEHPMRMERGILDVQIQVNDQYSFRAIVAHLKSKRQVPHGDQAVMRLEEAKLLRSHFGKALKANPELNLIAMGDFNDTPESEAIHTLIGEPPFNLFDLMPVDRKGGHDTHYWKARDLFSRIDYMIASSGMSNDYVAGSARIADVPEWNDASDHRAIYAQFYAHDIGGQSAGQPPTPPGSLPPSSVYAIAVAVVAAVVLIATIIVYRQRLAEKK